MPSAGWMSARKGMVALARSHASSSSKRASGGAAGCLACSAAMVSGVPWTTFVSSRACAARESSPRRARRRARAKTGSKPGFRGGGSAYASLSRRLGPSLARLFDEGLPFPAHELVYAAHDVPRAGRAASRTTMAGPDGLEEEHVRRLEQETRSSTLFLGRGDGPAEDALTDVRPRRGGDLRHGRGLSGVPIGEEVEVPRGVLAYPSILRLAQVVAARGQTEHRRTGWRWRIVVHQGVMRAGGDAVAPASAAALA